MKTIPQYPVQPFLARRFSMSVGERWSGHAHEDWHLLYVQSGEIEQAEGRNAIHLREGGWRLSPARICHDLAARQSTHCLNIHIRDARLSRRLTRRMAPKNHFVKGLPVSPSMPGELEHYEWVARIVRHAEGREGLCPDWLIDAHEEILSGAESIEAIAATYCVSREYFCRVFETFFGCSPKQAYQIQRCQRVYDRLVQSDEALVDIALDEGYFDQAHMCRAIRQKFGRTPNDIREGRSHFSNTIGSA